MVGQYVLHFVHGLIVAQDIADAVAATYHGQNLQKAQDGGYGRLREDVGPGTEYGGRMAALQHHQGIHEGVGVVGADEHGVLGRNGSVHREPAVTGPRTAIYIVAECGIKPVSFPDLTHACSS